MTNKPSLLDALRSRARKDADAFREKFPRDEPNERWLDNSFTATLPLAASDAGVDVALDPSLFAEYKKEIARVLGMRSVRPDAEKLDGATAS